MDELLRDLERTLRAAPDDGRAAVAYLRALARDAQGEPWAPAGVPQLPLPENRSAYAAARGDPKPPAVDVSRFEGGRFLGPLLALEAERLRDLDPEALDVDAVGIAWLRADDPRGRTLFAATLRVRLVALPEVVRNAPDTFESWCALHVALDAGGDAALDVLIEAVAQEPGRAGERAARLLASRPEPRVGRRLARVLRRSPAEQRPRIYGALARGSVPLDSEAKEDLRAAIARELPGTVREKAYGSLAKVATRADLERDFEEGKPEMRAAAFEALVARSLPADAHELVRHALADDDAEVRRAAVRLLSGKWIRHPRAIEWAIARLTDPDRAVRHDAVRLIRRTGVPARHMERLKLAVAGAPPGIRPQLLRLLELVQDRETKKRAR